MEDYPYGSMHLLLTYLGAHIPSIGSTLRTKYSLFRHYRGLNNWNKVLAVAIVSSLRGTLRKNY